MTIYTPIKITEEIERNFKPTRLSVKELNGIRYLCKSTKQDFEEYKGSGVHWKKIVKKYGRKNVKTLWISDWFYCPHHLQNFALMYSEYNQVVESEEWANLKPETGLDGNCNPAIIKAAMNRPEVKEKRKETDSKPEVKARRSAALNAANARPETKRKRSESAKKNYEDESKREMVTNRTNKMKETMALEETRKRISESVIETHWTKNTDAEEVMKRISESRTGVKYKRVVCEHCDKDVASNIYGRHHGDKCKHRLNK
jgi:hypothetical protein